MNRSFRAKTPEDTEYIGASLASAVQPGSIVLLEGDLGAGKTTFVRGLVFGLGGLGVKSPSFTLINEYHGNIPVAHADFYRLERADPRSMGLDEYLDDGWVVVVEWPDRLTSIPPFGGFKAVLKSLDLVDSLDEGIRLITLVSLDEDSGTRLRYLDFAGLEEIQ
nr:tRNA (adenosine(37)-N6)-threonylcarbamoyltransferase complex ATPase subunit type 1 TsaE [uncultured Dethiosulfovibrio sp.]